MQIVVTTEIVFIFRYESYMIHNHSYVAMNKLFLNSVRVAILQNRSNMLELHFFIANKAVATKKWGYHRNLSTKSGILCVVYGFGLSSSLLIC